MLLCNVVNLCLQLKFILLCKRMQSLRLFVFMPLLLDWIKWSILFLFLSASILF